MTLQDNAKLKEFKKYTVVHPMYGDALAVIHRSIEANTALSENSGAILVGLSGTGKTRLCDHLIAEFPKPCPLKRQDGIYSIKPVIYSRVPRDATVSALIARLLREFGDFNERQNREAAEYQLFQALETCGTQFLILDELPHLFRGGSNAAVRNAADFIKILSDIFRRSILLVGEPECEVIVNSRSSLSDRFPYRAKLYPLSLATPESWNDYLRVLRALSIEIKASMGFDEMPALTDERTALAFYAFTGGNFRALSNLLIAALTIALKRDDRQLMMEDFAAAGVYVKTSTSLCQVNPFTLSTKSLKKIIASQSERQKQS
jgi:type II secretory pathway predicted ATPase ExeA